MHPFTIVKAKTVKEAVAASQAGKAKFIAGGTNLVDLMKLYIETPEQLVDISALELKKIEALPNGGVRIGALVRNSDLAYDKIISTRYPVLSKALLEGASAQLRNMATTAGNILQRTRCYYFFDKAMPCNKREPGSGCSAIAGYNRNHAVLGASDKCIAAHPSDMCVALAALDATVHVEGPSGERNINFLDFHLLPGDTPEKENVLQPGDLITAIEIPALPFAAHSTYIKVRDRQSYEFALVSAAVALDVKDGTVQNVRIALGGVGTKPWRAKEAEQALIGKKANPNSYKAAADVALRDAKPHKDNAFKPELCKRTIVQALQTLGG